MAYASHSLVWEVAAGHCREVGSSSCSVSPLVPAGIPPLICDSAPQLFGLLPVREPIVGQLQCNESPSCPPASSILYAEVEMAGCSSNSLGYSRGDFNLDGLNPLPNKFSRFVWEPSDGMGSVLLNSGVPSGAPAARVPFAEVVKDGCCSDSFALDVGNCRGAVRLAGLDPLPNCFSRLAVEHLRGEDRMGGKSPSLKDGRPVIFLFEAELLDLSKPLQLTLVGKFSAGRPKWVEVNKFFSDLKLRGEFKIANLDARHMVIHLQHLDDYIRLFSKQFQYINGYTVKFLKWTIDFNVNTELAVSPVWISLPRLGLHLYTPNLLFSIASVYGRPLRLDYATRHWSRPSAARILVEMDLRSHHSNEVWIGSDSNGYFQKVCFENLPRYCMHCQKIGHNDDNCFLLFPELRKEHGLKNSMGNGMHSNVELHKGFDGNIDVEGGGASTSNGGVMLEQLDNSSGAGVNTLDSVEGLQAEMLDGNVSSLDSMSGQDILGAEKQVPLVEDVGMECIHRDVVFVDEGSLVSDLDISPRADFMLHSVPNGDSFDFTIAGCKTQNKASTSKRFTRSSLKEIDGQQLFLQWQGTEKKMDKVFNIIDRVLDDNVRLEELKRHRENAVALKEEEKKKREEKKVVAATRLQVKLESKKSKGKGKGKKK